MARQTRSTIGPYSVTICSNGLIVTPGRRRAGPEREAGPPESSLESRKALGGLGFRSLGLFPDG
jgi:hypothetical protein